MINFGDPVLDFDFENASQLELYRRRLEMLYSTVEGSCPGDRNFGLAADWQDETSEVAKSTYSLEVTNKTEEYVPEVEIVDISFEHGEDGVLIPRIVFELNDEMEEDEEDE